MRTPIQEHEAIYESVEPKPATPDEMLHEYAAISRRILELKADPAVQEILGQQQALERVTKEIKEAAHTFGMSWKGSGFEVVTSRKVKTVVDAERIARERPDLVDLGVVVKREIIEFNAKHAADMEKYGEIEPGALAPYTTYENLTPAVTIRPLTR